MEIIQVFAQMDWVFAFVLLIGGRYWGSRYFKVTRNSDLNFLAFATLFGALWIAVQYFFGEFSKTQVGSLFMTYLFTTSFYQLLAKQLFKFVESKFKTDETD